MEKAFFIGDVHGCYDELIELLKLKPDSRKNYYLGDIADRGNNSLGVINHVYDEFINNQAKLIRGNHCNKVYRYFKGNQVSVNGGIRTTIKELEKLSEEEQQKLKNKFITLYEKGSYYQAFARNNVIAVHGSWRDDVLNMTNNRDIESVCLYANASGEKGADGFPTDWKLNYKGKKTIIYGHIVHEQPYIFNNIYGLDTGCVHGGHLTGLLFPEMKIIQVKAKDIYFQSKR